MIIKNSKLTSLNKQKRNKASLMQKSKATMIRIERWKKRKMRSYKKSMMRPKNNYVNQSGEPVGLEKMKNSKLITIFEGNKFKREKKFRMSTS